MSGISNFIKKTLCPWEMHDRQKKLNVTHKKHDYQCKMYNETENQAE